MQTTRKAPTSQQATKTNATFGCMVLEPWLPEIVDCNFEKILLLRNMCGEIFMIDLEHYMDIGDTTFWLRLVRCEPNPDPSKLRFTQVLKGDEKVRVWKELMEIAMRQPRVFGHNYFFYEFTCKLSDIAQ